MTTIEQALAEVDRACEELRDRIFDLAIVEWSSQKPGGLQTAAEVLQACWVTQDAARDAARVAAEHGLDLEELILDALRDSAARARLAADVLDSHRESLALEAN
jgi:hypothetical protein